MFPSRILPVLVILVIAAGVVLLNWLVVRSLGFEAPFSATGYHSNLSRLHDFDDAGEPEVLLVGSSITGRFLPSYFSGGAGEVVNLGLDAAGSSTSAEIVLEGSVKPKVLVLESNGLRKAPNDAGLIIMDTRNTASYHIAAAIPPVRPGFRPSDVLYSRLKVWKDSRGGQKLPEFDPAKLPATRWDPDYVNALLDDLRGRCDRLVIVNYPSISQSDPDLVVLLRDLSARDESIVYLDLHEEMKDEGLRFTDKVHLAAPSARKVAEHLEQHIETIR